MSTDDRYQIIVGDCLTTLRTLEAGSVHVCITSPPYYALRDYGTGTWEGGAVEGCDHKASTARNDGGRAAVDGFNGSAAPDSDKGAILFRATCGKCGARRIDQQLGSEDTPAAYVARLVEVFREVRRILRDDGVCFVNLGDSYNSAGGCNGGGKHTLSREPRSKNLGHVTDCKPKDLLGIPWQVALALRADGWTLRSEIPWVRANPMPSSVRDRPTTSHETVFLLSKRPRYYWDPQAVAVGSVSGANGSTFTSGKTFEAANALNAVGTGERADDSQSRNLRTADFFFDSLDDAITATRAHLEHLERVRAQGGLLCDEGGDPLALLVNPQPLKLSHFAAFPEKLVRPMVLAATSAHGCCPRCGAGWRRVVEKTRKAARPGDVSKTYKVSVNGGRHQNLSSLKPAEVGNRDPARHCTTTATLGWEPGCACGEPTTVPALVLDCFSGAGTTGVVALQCGRRYLGIELNPDYAAMSVERIELAQPLGLFDAPANGSTTTTATPSLFGEEVQ